MAQIGKMSRGWSQQGIFSQLNMFIITPNTILYIYILLIYFEGGLKFKSIGIS